jgi:mRNA interferase YafQ
MRTIRRTAAFKRDYKRERKGRHRKTIDDDLLRVVTMLANDEPLAERHHDHPLVGEWKDHRNCHVRPDLILVYRKMDENTLDLVRLGSHSKLGL